MKAARRLQPLLRRPLTSSVSARSPALLRSPTIAYSLSASQARPYSQITRRGPSSTPSYPSDTEYSDSTVYAFSYISRVIRYLLYGVITLGGVSIVTFEGLHLYVEKVCLAAPSRDGADDPYGWIGENQGWTGGSKGGTDPRLGQKARHALRGAWICQEWGAGGSATSALSKSVVGGSTSFHPDYVAVKGMIGQQDGGIGGSSGRQTVDRGYELAEEFINLAISEAKKKGLVFPPNLSSSPGSSSSLPIHNESTHGVPQGDPAVLDLLLLKAGILERINTTDSLLHARDLYQQVLNSMNHSQDEQHLHIQARIMRLAGKLGDLSARTGNSDLAMQYWSWGLDNAGIKLDKPSAGVSEVLEEVKKESKSWFGFGRSKASKRPEPLESSVTSSSATSLPQLPPAILRSSISLLISASAHLATTSSLSSASSLQSQALSLIPPSTTLANATSSSADSVLHDTWLQQRAALLKLHQASVLHARNVKSTSGEPLRLITEAQSISEKIISSIQTIPAAYTTPRSSSLSGPAKLLRRDALLTGAEIAYTRGVFLERSLPAENEKESRLQQLEQAAECFERAMSLNVLESGVEKKDNDEIGQGEDWGKYWRGYVRVRGKLGALVEPAAKEI